MYLNNLKINNFNFIKPLKSEAIHETGLSGNVVTSLFSSHNIYPALLQRIEHCSTRKSTCRLPMYVCMYVYMYIFIVFLNIFQKHGEVCEGAINPRIKNLANVLLE